MAYKGPDISAYQGDIDIKKLASEVDFFIFRGYAGLSKDKKVERNVKLCIEAGKPYGLYIYSYALNTERAKQEAQNLINLANSFSVKPNFLVIDMEDADGYKKKNGMPSNQTLRDICTIEGNMFEQAGYYAMVYASSSWFNNQLKGLTKFAKWIAHWPVKNGKQTGNSTPSTGENANNCAIWQFTSEGRLNGYNGRLDMNYGYKDIVVKKSNTVIPSKPSTPVQPSKKSVDEIAKEVIEGKWGNGQDRKDRLTKAGYNYSEVQKKVNELVAKKPSAKPTVSYYKACSSRYNSLVDALNSIGVNSSFIYRRKIAIKNNVRPYIGTANQNKRLLDKLKAGRLIKV